MEDRRKILSFDEVNTKVVCDAFGGTIRDIDLACVVKTPEGEEVYMRVDPRHGGSKIFSFWRKKSGVAQMDMGRDMYCEVDEGKFVCYSKTSINNIIEIRRLRKGELRVDIIGPKVSYSDFVR